MAALRKLELTKLNTDAPVVEALPPLDWFNALYELVKVSHRVMSVEALTNRIARGLDMPGGKDRYNIAAQERNQWVAASMLRTLFNWLRKSKRRDGGVYISVSEWERYCGATRKEVEGALPYLLMMGVEAYQPNEPNRSLHYVISEPERLYLLISEALGFELDYVRYKLTMAGIRQRKEAGLSRKSIYEGTAKRANNRKSIYEGSTENALQSFMHNKESQPIQQHTHNESTNNTTPPEHEAVIKFPERDRGGGVSRILPIKDMTVYQLLRSAGVNDPKAREFSGCDEGKVRDLITQSVSKGNAGGWLVAALAKGAADVVEAPEKDYTGGKYAAFIEDGVTDDERGVVGNSGERLGGLIAGMQALSSSTDAESETVESELSPADEINKPPPLSAWTQQTTPPHSDREGNSTNDIFSGVNLDLWRQFLKLVKRDYLIHYRDLVDARVERVFHSDGDGLWVIVEDDGAKKRLKRLAHEFRDMMRTEAGRKVFFVFDTQGQRKD